MANTTRADTQATPQAQVGGIENPQRTIQELRKAADAGDAVAMYNIGTLYYSGQGVVRDYQQAMTWFCKSADAGNTYAMCFIGALYANGQGVAQDYRQATAWYRKSADAGNTYAMCFMGALYANGQGVAQDYRQAMSWYRKAADAGNASAMVSIGTLYYSGRGVAQDYQQAMTWYREAADSGDAGGMCFIGALYASGNGVAQDYRQAMAWYRKAADAGNAGAMNNIGFLYEHGQGVAQDYQQAMTWYGKAVDAGIASAMYNIGFLYANGRGVAQDYHEAMTWYRKAAGTGNADAMNSIGVLYDDGDGVAQDYQQAMAWYRKAADAGNAVAMYNIAVLYDNNDSATEDYQRLMAWAWYCKAATAGNAHAKVRLAELGAQPSTNQSSTASTGTNGATLVAMDEVSSGQTAKPSTQPDHQTQESILAAKIVDDDDRVITATAAQEAAQKDFDADLAHARSVLVNDICGADADIAADKISLFLKDPTENGTRVWSHPEVFPSATSAMTVWCTAEIDVINVRDFWFIIDGQGAIHVSAIKPSRLDLSKVSAEWEYPAEIGIHIDIASIAERINLLHNKVHFAALTFPKHADDFYTWTILFQSERAHYTPTAWDESRQGYVGGDTSEAAVNGYPVAENGSYFGEISTVNGLPRTHYVNGYYRADGTYVRSYYRSR
jgi:hypothetical protein